MIETLNDLMSLVFIGILILFLTYFMYEVLLAHKLVKIEKQEQDYYDISDDEGYITHQD